MPRRIRAAIPLLIGMGSLVLSAGLTAALISFRKPPASASTKDIERAIRVEAIEVQPKDVPVIISSYGEVKSLDVVPIAPEVSGVVVEIHPNLLVGGTIQKGELLFAIDPAPYQARLDEASALVGQLEATVKRIQSEWENEKERLSVLERSRALAKAQFDRLSDLMKQDVGTQSDVDASERAYVQADDAVKQQLHALSLFPMRLEEAQNAAHAAKSQAELARLNLEKTRVAAPFDARVKWVALEKDQFVSPGKDVLQLANDSVLEIAAPLDSRDARRWMKFTNEHPLPGAAWFANPEPVECKIRWTEDIEGHCWYGVLNRVESFDESSRTLTVAIRLAGDQALSKDEDRLPLVEGMFCLVEIPGKTMRGVYELPPSAVTLDYNVYTVVDNRLKTTPVEIAHMQGDYLYAAAGLNPGDLVVATRLVNPLENSLLEVSPANAAHDRTASSSRN